LSFLENQERSTDNHKHRNGTVESSVVTHFDQNESLPNRLMGQYYTNQAVEFGLLVMGREARGEDYDTILKMGWSIRNRVTSPRWWGHDWISVITKPEQYTSMVPPPKDKDPNLTVYPDPKDAHWGPHHRGSRSGLLGCRRGPHERRYALL
jgi:hypothetical protein